MEEMVYMSIRVLVVVYLLHKVWGQKSRIREVCDLLYTPPSKKGTVDVSSVNPVNEKDVIGATRFVYLDENAGKNVAPYMTQQLEMGSDYIGEEATVSEDEVECNLPLDEMRMLQEEQEELDKQALDVDVFTETITPSDLFITGDVLFNLNDAGLDEEKSRRAAQTLHAIRETDMFEIITSQVENKGVIEDLMRKYLDESGSIQLNHKRQELDWRALI